MPLLFPVRGRVMVFLQNRYLLGLNSLRQFQLKIAMRIAFKRAVCVLFRHRVGEYMVQTKTMAEDLRRWHGGDPPVRVLLFADLFDTVYTGNCTADSYDFVCVASGDAHKNHEHLINPWLLLARAGLFRSLALTLDSENRRLLDTYERLRSESEFRTSNLSALSREQLLELYHSTFEMDYPSTSKSLGLLLVEAAASGLPIVAAELDYVRDVVTPVETFDPESPLSIARAVHRLLGCPETPASVMTASEFLEGILQQ